MSDWKSLLKERFMTKEGRVEELHLLQGPTYPCEFYAGPIFERFRLDGRGMERLPQSWTSEGKTCLAGMRQQEEAVSFRHHNEKETRT